MRSKNFWNNLLRRKVPKTLYFAGALLRYITPKSWTQHRLPALLKEAERRADWEYNRDRVD